MKSFGYRISSTDIDRAYDNPMFDYELRITSEEYRGDLVGIASVTRFDVARLAEFDRQLGIKCTRPTPDGFDLVVELDLDVDIVNGNDIRSKYVFVDENFAFDELVVFKWVGVTELGESESDLGHFILGCYRRFFSPQSTQVVFLPEYRFIETQGDDLKVGRPIDPPFEPMQHEGTLPLVKDGMAKISFGHPAKRRRPFLLAIDHVDHSPVAM